MILWLDLVSIRVNGVRIGSVDPEGFSISMVTVMDIVRLVAYTSPAAKTTPPAVSTTLTETALASYILATENTVKLKLLIYNSAPVQPRDRNTPIEEATIHLVEEKEINHLDAKKILYTQLSLHLLKQTYQPNPIRSPLGLKIPEHNRQGWIKLMENIKYFVISAELGLSLPLAYLIDEINSTDIQELYRTAEKFSYIKDCSDLVNIDDETIEYKYVLRYEAALSLTLSNSINPMGLL